MILWLLLCIAAVGFVALPGCQRVADRGTSSEHPQPAETSLAFDLEPVQGPGDGSEQWIGKYNSGGKIARFRMDFGAAETTPGKAAGDPAVKSGEGTLLPEAGSDSSVLLVNLQKALQAKTAPTIPATKTSVPFTYIKIGENLSQSGGGFNANPPGNWTALKLIFGDGARESEIFLGINASLKKAQFSMKDPGYGDLVLAELAKVL